MQADIPYRALGTTGARVSAIGLGGWHLGLPRLDESLSLRITRTAIDRGINFLDNCWDYNGVRARHGWARRSPTATVARCS